MINPKNDGIDHINIYSKGKTEIGRLLSNFANTPFTYEPYGTFQSVEGFWYYYFSGCKHEHLKDLFGSSAKKAGQLLISSEHEVSADDRIVILGAINNKLKQNRYILDLITEDTLPFEHYYVVGEDGDRIIDKGEYKWISDEFERIRDLMIKDLVRKQIDKLRLKKIILTEASDYEKELCLFFANNCVETNRDKYKDRKQEDVDKIINDIYNGKLAEVMVYRCLMNKNKNPHPIDFIIYEKSFKSFGPDMFLDGGQRVHVKSCLQNSYFPNSWVFQPEDKLVTSPTSDDFLALVAMGDRSYCYITEATKVEYGEPIKKELNKKVIYEQNLN